MVHVTPQFRIYFGDASDEMYPNEYVNWHNDLFLKAPITKVCDALQLYNIMFLQQKHGINGINITSKNFLMITPFSFQGDFLITQMKRIGIGILSADCLPVLAYDKKLHVAGIAHAGWRGAFAGVVLSMISTMKNEYNSCSSDLIVFFGPSAKHCCYEVSKDFLEYLDPYPFARSVLIKRADRFYLDLPGFIGCQLQQHDMSPFQMRREYNECTICNFRFHSHRRALHSNRKAGRQMTVIMLK